MTLTSEQDLAIAPPTNGFEVVAVLKSPSAPNIVALRNLATNKITVGSDAIAPPVFSPVSNTLDAQAFVRANDIGLNDPHGDVERSFPLRDVLAFVSKIDDALRGLPVAA